VSTATPPTRVLILGSCASRDAFGSAAAPAPGFSVVDYHARTSLASLAAAAPALDVDVTKIASSFQRRMVQRDVQKSVFERLGRVEFDILLLDFIDDRFNLLVFADGGALTESNELRAAHPQLRPQAACLVEPFSADFEARWEHGWARLWRELGTIGRHEAVLVNPVFWATHQEDGTALPNQPLIAAANRYLAGRYERLARDLPAHQFIAYDRSVFASSSAHRWGPAPFHYTAAVEQACRAGVRRHHRRLLDQTGAPMPGPDQR
jgi:hypothetical protein